MSVQQIQLRWRTCDIAASRALVRKQALFLVGSVRGVRANFTGLVLGFTKTDFCKQENSRGDLRNALQPISLKSLFRCQFLPILAKIKLCWMFLKFADLCETNTKIDEL